MRMDVVSLDDTLFIIRKLLRTEVEWFNENIGDQDMLYDVCIDMFTQLDRGKAYTLLKLIATGEE